MLDTPHSASSSRRSARYSRGCSTAKHRSSSSDCRQGGRAGQGRRRGPPIDQGANMYRQRIVLLPPTRPSPLPARPPAHPHTHLERKHAEALGQGAPHPARLAGHGALLLRGQRIAAEEGRGGEGGGARAGRVRAGRQCNVSVEEWEVERQDERCRPGHYCGGEVLPPRHAMQHLTDQPTNQRAREATVGWTDSLTRCACCASGRRA